MVSQSADKFDFDVALSFAGEDRKYVEQVAGFLQEMGIRVFYDKYEEVTLCKGVSKGVTVKGSGFHSKGVRLPQ